MSIVGTSASETLSGTPGDDIIDGLGGDDSLTGGAGNDIFLYSALFGNDVITDFVHGVDKIDLSAFYIADLATLSPFIAQVGSDTVISFGYNGSAESITLSNFTASTLSAGDFIFDATTITRAPAGTANADVLFGAGGADQIYAGRGDDVVSAGGGNDYIDGDAGNDTLTGGSGNDIFAYLENQFGADIITDFTVGSDRIDLSGLNIGDFATIQPFLSQSGSDALLLFAGSTSSESIRLKSVSPAGLSASNFIFNSSSLSLSTTGSAGDDMLFGASGVDTLNGVGGNDLLVGGSGADTLDGGAGNDVLYGGAGNDVFLFSSRGFGDDVIKDFAQGDRISIAITGISNFADLQPFLTQVGSDTVVTLSYNSQSESITLANVQASSLVSDNFNFASTTGQTQTGSAGADILLGSSGNDTLNGSGGNDTVYGNAGNDKLSGGAGDDHIYGGTGYDEVIFSGAISNYSIQLIGTKTYLVTDLSGGSLDGTDTLYDVESLHFSDGYIGLPAGPIARSDFNGDHYDDILFRDASGTFATWEMNGAAHAGGGVLGNPGGSWTYYGLGDFNGDGKSDLLFQNSNGDIATWQMDGTTIAGGGVIGNPGSNWALVGSGDFNGDGKTDILFRNLLTGGYGTWDINGTTIIGGGAMNNGIANTQNLRAIADINGDGKSDIIFADGTVWLVNDLQVQLDSRTIGTGYTLLSYGDFSGDGVTDRMLLYRDGRYYGSGTGSGVTLGSPGAGWTFVGANDYNGDGRTDLLFQNDNGSVGAWILSGTAGVSGGNLGNPGGTYLLATAPTGWTQPFVHFLKTDGTVARWQVNVSAVSATSTINSPGAAWTAKAVGDFNGTDGQSPLVIYQNTSGLVAIQGLGNVGNPGSWSLLASGDFNGDGKSDIIFQNDTTHQYATWDLNGNKIIGGGTLGIAAGYTFKGIGDFNGDGKADVLFQFGDGTLATWHLNDTTITGGGVIGNPGAGWTYQGIGDFNGDGKSDILFRSAGGVYATWDMNGTSIFGGGTLDNPQGTWQLAEILDLNGNGTSDLVFQDASGNVATWLLSDTHIVGGAVLGNIGTQWHAFG